MISKIFCQCGEYEFPLNAYSKQINGRVHYQQDGSRSCEAKQLTSGLNLPATFNTPGGPADEIDQLKKRVAFLERELAGAEDRYLKLDQIYNKLADQWSVFQATTRPDNRNIQRAEGAGEMARKLAEVLLSAAYGTDARDLLRKLLEDMEGGSGRTVEVGGKLVKK